NQIPSNFNPRQYADPDKVMQAIRAFSIEPGFTEPVDRWSFGIKQTVWDDVSSGVAGDFGMNVFFRAEGDLRVKNVEPNSAAGKAGIRRGWRITKINNNTNMTTSNADFIVNAVWGSAASSFTFSKPDGTSVDVNLNAGSYVEDPVYMDTVYTIGAKKVGYFVFNSFLGDTSQIYNDFNKLFSRFAAEDVSDVIVDLRYNGGGYVSVQQKLANYLVPSAGNGNVMMSQEFNNKYSIYNETYEFNKIGNLNLNRIFFIVSDNTASASELLINNLEPFMEVKLVGPSATYGKPVGYFNIPVGDWYVFPVSFRSTNKLGQGNYFNGIQTDKQTADGLDKDFGDQDEASLSSIVKYINSGTFGYVGERPGGAIIEAGKSAPVNNANRKLEHVRFRGMVDKPRF
ncbi:MAG: S41 family peptidase, partial [Flavitalea sp.]